jgi:Ca2+:H+ antiporter
MLEKTEPLRSRRGALLSLLRHEWLLPISIGTSFAFFRWGDSIFAALEHPAGRVVVFVWLFGVMLASALTVVRHAETLAERLGEPYGTLILTLSVTFIEVMSISAVMLHGENNPTLVRDTLFAVVMIILNGMVGLSLLVGAWRHREQSYNLQGANAYLGAVVPLVVLSLVLPTFTVTTKGPTLSNAQQAFVVLAAVGLYAVFLAMQTGRHRGYFTHGEELGEEKTLAARAPIGWPAGMLALYMAPVVFLAEQLARPIDYVIETLHAPTALGGIAMAVLVATPEATGAVRAAAANHLQRSVNIFLGSVLSTIGLTVPAMILMSHLTGRPFILGVEGADLVLLLLTLAVSFLRQRPHQCHSGRGASDSFRRLFAAHLSGLNGLVAGLDRVEESQGPSHKF